MTTIELEFLKLAKQYETEKKHLKATGEQLEALMLDIGLDSYIQDPEDGTVYKIYKPDGTFVSFKSIDWKRTAKEGEKGGTVLSKSKAMSMGYIVGKK